MCCTASEKFRFAHRDSFSVDSPFCVSLRRFRFEKIDILMRDFKDDVEVRVVEFQRKDFSNARGKIINDIDVTFMAQ